MLRQVSVAIPPPGPAGGFLEWFACERAPSEGFESRDMTTAGLPISTRFEAAPAAGVDLSLVERLRAGNVAAVAEAYDRHADAVRAFALRLVGDTSAAEDLVHEVFVALPRASRGYREQSSLRTFLISVAVNHAKHYVRAAARRRSALDRLAREPDAVAPPDPERDLQRRQLAQVLSAALDKLPLDQRVAFVLCEVEERTAGEAALIAGVPEATLRTRLFHAKRKLRERLAKQGVA